MATEAALQSAIQTILQSITGTFASADVVINDWSILDGPRDSAPFAIIENSDDFSGLQRTSDANTRRDIPVTLAVRLGPDTWKEAQDNFRDAREAILSKFNEVGTARSAGGLEGVDITEIRSAGPIGYIYPIYVEPQNQPFVNPDFVSQRIIFVVEEF